MIIYRNRYDVHNFLQQPDHGFSYVTCILLLKCNVQTWKRPKHSISYKE